MEAKIKLFSMVMLWFSVLSVSAKSNITWWCNLTPYPQPCQRFVRQYLPRSEPNHRSEFREMLVQLALRGAINAQSKVVHFGPFCENHLHRAVWDDCLKLHENTVYQLNRTLQCLRTKRRRNCTDFDVQTWLSSALTNIQTCRLGSADFNLSDFVAPVAFSNLSMLISNSLAINGALLQAEKNNTQGFPSWFSWQEKRWLLQSSEVTKKANMVVAKDGSGHVRTIQEAIDAASHRVYGTRFIIYVKKGVYRENVEVGLNNSNIWLIGDGIKRTIITSCRSVGGGYTTYSSATAGVDGLGFVARGITFSNTAGPLKGQAVALRSASDLAVFYKCAFQGYQDTVFVQSQRQFFRECYIYGTVDFIFGNAAVVLQNCEIYVRKPLNGQPNVITAQGRYDPFQNTGISIHNSKILPAPDLKPVVGSFRTYLGRPWMQYSRTVILKTYIDSFVTPSGWLKWEKGDFALDTLFYAEYQNSGPGASTRFRVKWKGFHVIKSADMASRFTVGSLIGGQSWLPAIGVPFAYGL
ncbi:hypothetical protein K2173_027315 [Erythroxylum novogranatense]|uniref:Pectinesterase n=1 Tax=Erythroxylum novogranatense TaxID=1862640 RepID=A0AAV8TZ09_9ROSI|nr:hypothetical protein K2173_027315 [Erythroxylum novogranatense]